MGLQETDFFSDLNDSEKFAAGIVRKERRLDIFIKKVVDILKRRGVGLQNNNIDEVKLFEEDLL
jgi:hypothetical protein